MWLAWVLLGGPGLSAALAQTSEQTLHDLAYRMSNVNAAEQSSADGQTQEMRRARDSERAGRLAAEKGKREEEQARLADMAQVRLKADRDFAKEMRRHRNHLARLRGESGGGIIAADGAGAALERFAAGEEGAALQALDRIVADRRAAKKPAREQADASDPETDKALARTNQQLREQQRNVEDALDLRALANLALLAYQRGAVPLSVPLEKFKEVVRLDPTEVADSVVLARLHRQAGDFDAVKKAAAVAERLAVAAGDRPLALSETGLTLRLAGGLREARRVLEAALKLREEAWQAEPGAADLKRYLSVALERRGELALDEGSFKRAIEDFERCIKLRQELVSEQAVFESSLAMIPAEDRAWVVPRPAPMRDLAVAFGHLARAHLERADLPAASQALREALRHADRVAQADEQNVEWQRDLAVLRARQADIAALSGQTEEARRWREGSLEDRRRLLARDAGSPRLRRDVGVALVALGDMFFREANLAQARSHYDQAAGLLAAPDSAVPDATAQSRRDQIMLKVRQSQLWAKSRDDKEVAAARRGYREALEALGKLDREEPDQWAVQRDRASVLMRQGDSQLEWRGLQDKKAAIGSFEEALELREGMLRRDPQERVLRAWVWHSLNRLGAAYSDLPDAKKAQPFKDRARQMLESLQADKRGLDGIPESGEMLLAAAHLAESLADGSYAEKLRPVLEAMKSRNLLSKSELGKFEEVRRRSGF